MDRDDFERLVLVEERVEVVRKDLEEHRAESKERCEELKQLIVALGVKVDASSFRWSAVLTRENIRLIIGLILTLTGAAGAAKLFEP